MIPKIIHCCWFSGTEKTPLAKKCMESWRRFAPDWEIREWSAEDVLRLSPPRFFHDALNAGKWAFASDWARFAVIAAEGGVYLDLDVELVAQINDLVETGAFFALSSDNPKCVDPGLGFAAEKGDPVCAEIAMNYSRMDFDPACHLSQTAPSVANRVLKNHPSRRLLPAAFFNPKGTCAGEIRLSPETRGIHHYAASWFNWKQRLAYIWWPKIRRRIFTARSGSDLV